MSALKLDVEAFTRRIEKFYQAFKDDRSFPELSATDCFVCAVGDDDEMVYSKSTSIQTWLFGYELPDTIVLFCESAIYILSSKKKIDFFRQIEKVECIPSVKLLVRDKTDNDKKNFQCLIEAARESRKGSTLGVIAKDQKYPGSFMDGWRSQLSKSNLSTSDVSTAITILMAPKEEVELNHVRKASQVTSDVFSKYLKEQIMDIIDSDKQVKHSTLAEGVEKAITDKKYAANLDTSLLDICYPAIIQSGGNYKLKFSMVSDKDNLHFGAIICSFGARYRSYCSNIIRTMLVDPSEMIQGTYDFLVECEDYLISLLMDGACLGDVYAKTLKKVEKERPDLVDKLTKSFGFSMGIEFRDNTIAITQGCTAVVKKGMIFNVNIGLSGLVNKDAQDSKGKVVALFIGDTVIAGENAPATVLTTSKKRIKNIAIFLKDADSEGEEKGLPDPHQFGRGKRTAVFEQKLRLDPSAEEKRKHHQRELLFKMNEEALHRLKNGVSVKEQAKSRKAPVAYKSPGQLPRESEVRQLKIYVDKKYETMILPIFGVPVPFHIATVKNVAQSVEGDYTYLRINFFHPGASIGKDGAGNFSNPSATCLKELTYRSTNVKEPGELSAPSSNLNTAFRLIKEMQKSYKAREAEEKERADLVQQDSLVLSQAKGNPKLRDLYIRPNMVQKRLSGVLEAHANGFRFTSIRGDKVDLLYNNIKHAVFQPCDGEMIILLHFNLKNAVMFGKKKQTDVQFYTEVGEITTDLGKHQHMHDRDDLAAEQAERELRHKLKQAFKGFCDRVTAATKDDLEFDVPFRELGFFGVPFRETVLLQPTSSCLVNLTNWPPFVVTLEEIELVHFERVQFHLKNFDMVFIFKDYSKKVVMVTAIPMHVLENVKEWLNSADIKYTEGIQSLNWPKIMKTIVEAPEDFFESGGWSFLDPESDSEEADDEEDSEDEEYKDSEDEETEDSESEDNYSSEASEDYSEQELDSDESSGKDWSDLEREAEEEDDEMNTTGSANRVKKPKPRKERSPVKASKSHDKQHSDKRKRGRDRSSSSSQKSPKKKARR